MNGAGQLGESVDLLVIGSGAGGLSAAVTAAHLGLKVLVVEKEAQYGGTTAWSGGWMWVPRNPLAVAAGITEDISQPLSYLKHELGARYDEALALAFLESGPRMVEFFKNQTALQFIDGNAIPDFHGRTPHASMGGRSICAAPFDGRQLGANIAALKPPLPETTLWGMGIASGAELRHFLNAMRKPASFWYVTQQVLRYGRDLLIHHRGMRLVNVNALVAGLAASALARAAIRTSRPAAVCWWKRAGSWVRLWVALAVTLKSVPGAVWCWPVVAFPTTLPVKRNFYPMRPRARSTGRLPRVATPVMVCVWVKQWAAWWQPIWCRPPHWRRCRWSHMLTAQWRISLI